MPVRLWYCLLTPEAAIREAPIALNPASIMGGSRIGRRSGARGEGAGAPGGGTGLTGHVTVATLIGRADSSEVVMGDVICATLGLHSITLQAKNPVARILWE